MALCASMERQTLPQVGLLSIPLLISPTFTTFHHLLPFGVQMLRTWQHCELCVWLQVTGLASSWISPRGNTTAPCLECATSAACPNTECLHHLPVSRGVLDRVLASLAVLLLHE